MSSRSSARAAPASSHARVSCSASGPPGGASSRARPRVIVRATRRCWAPSCRSRSMRRRSASKASTRRARERVSSATLARVSVSGGAIRRRVRVARAPAATPMAYAPAASSSTPSAAAANAVGSPATVHTFRTFTSRPPPTVTSSSGVAIIARGDSRATVSRSASAGQRTQAVRRVCPSSRHVARSLNRVTSQACRPGAAGSMCAPGARAPSTHRSLRRSSAATGSPARTVAASRGSPTTTIARTPPAATHAASPTSRAAPRAAPASRKAAARHGQGESR